jgi:hypothetical protein
MLHVPVELYVAWLAAQAISVPARSVETFAHRDEMRWCDSNVVH